ncbi:MAG: DNA polymerase IV [Planctomycetota bacterium]|jgi:DNA polymerase-4|nr:DNA polymerase IV [Planctomycetota bacterium]
MNLWKRAILHVDMDAFYASVEQLDHPELRGKPILVGGSPESRGVVSAASYEARRYGARSAIPMARAIRLCPQAVVIAPPRMERYREVSDLVFAIFNRVTPLVQPVSLDEAFLDVTGCQRLHGDPVAIARRIRLSIKRETGLTASVGVASCRSVAKIASDLDKPDGLTVISVEETLERLAPLAVSRIWGVGPVAGGKLEKLGVKTIGQLREWPEDALVNVLGVAGSSLYRLARGIDDSPVEPDGEEKSVSHETTFARDVCDLGELETVLLGLAEKVAERLRRRGLAGRTVFIKLRYDDFTTLTRRKTLPAATCLAAAIARHGVELLRDRTAAGKRPVRLVGVGVAGFTDQPAQKVLFRETEQDDARQERLERTADRIREKLGKEAIQRASLKFRG